MGEKKGRARRPASLLDRANRWNRVKSGSRPASSPVTSSYYLVPCESLLAWDTLHSEGQMAHCAEGHTREVTGEEPKVSGRKPEFQRGESATGKGLQTFCRRAWGPWEFGLPRGLWPICLSSMALGMGLPGIQRKSVCGVDSCGTAQTQNLTVSFQASKIVAGFPWRT